MVDNNEHRRSERYDVEEIHGNVLYTSDVDILNISIDGAAIETTKRLAMNREYTFMFKYRDTFLNLKGLVVWEMLVSKEAKDSKTFTPVYRAGVRFADTLNEKAKILMDFIAENKTKAFEHRLGGMRFIVGNSEDVKIGVSCEYMVKKLSLSGMLVETCYPIDLESNHEMEILLNGNILKITGRIADCEKIAGIDIDKYAIGIEFVKISDDDKKILSDFLKTWK
jgi:hypothetical protein